jgi:hypothetical protein
MPSLPANMHAHIAAVFTSHAHTAAASVSHHMPVVPPLLLQAQTQMRVWAPRAALAPLWQTKQQRSSKVIPRCARLPPLRRLPLLPLHSLLPIPLRLLLPVIQLRPPLVLPPLRARLLLRKRRQRRRAQTVRPRPCRNECLLASRLRPPIALCV